MDPAALVLVATIISVLVIIFGIFSLLMKDETPILVMIGIILGSSAFTALMFGLFSFWEWVFIT